MRSYLLDNRRSCGGTRIADGGSRVALIASLLDQVQVLGVRLGWGHCVISNQWWERGSDANGYLLWQRDSLVYQPRTSSQSTTWLSLERDKFVGRWCVALTVLRYCIKGKRSEFFARWSSVVLYSCEIWTLTGKLKRNLNCGTMSLRRILDYHRHGYMSNDLVLRETGLIQVTCIVRDRGLRLCGMWLDSLRRIPPIGFVVVEFPVPGLCRGANTRFTFASGAVLSERYGSNGPCVWPGDIHTEAEGVSSQCGREDALLLCMHPYLTLPEMVHSGVGMRPVNYVKYMRMTVLVSEFTMGVGVPLQVVSVTRRSGMRTHTWAVLSQSYRTCYTFFVSSLLARMHAYIFSRFSDEIVEY